MMHIMARCKLMVALLLVSCSALRLSGITSIRAYMCTHHLPAFWVCVCVTPCGGNTGFICNMWVLIQEMTLVSCTNISCHVHSCILQLVIQRVKVKQQVPNCNPIVKYSNQLCSQVGKLQGVGQSWMRTSSVCLLEVQIVRYWLHASTWKMMVQCH